MIVVVHDTSQLAISASYIVGGSESQTLDQPDTPRLFAISTWAAEVCVSFFTEQKALPNNIVISVDSREEFKSTLCALADVLLQNSVLLPPAPRVQDYSDVLRKEFVQLTPDRHIALPRGVTFGSPHKQTMTLSERFLSECKGNTNIDAESNILVKCRLRNTNDSPITSLSISSLSNSSFLLDVLVTRDCGLNLHLKQGSWCALDAIVTNRDALLVTPQTVPASLNSILVHTKNFNTLPMRLSEMQIDSDTEETSNK